MKEKRIHSMAHYLKQVGMASYEELSKQFGCSKNTIRRDIVQLEEQGVLKRIHGGVSYSSEEKIIPVMIREESAQPEKQRIGQLASSLVAEGEILFVDSGTTTTGLIPWLEHKNVTIVTANLAAITLACSLQGVTVIALGGTYCRATHSFSGVNTIDSLKKINLNKVFLGATAISLHHGLSSNSFLETEIKRAVIQKTATMIAMLDHTKFGQSAMLSFLPLEDLDTLVTDQKPSEDYQIVLQQLGVSCLNPVDTPIWNQEEDQDHEVSDENVR